MTAVLSLAAVLVAGMPSLSGGGPAQSAGSQPARGSEEVSSAAGGDTLTPRSGSFAVAPTNEPIPAKVHRYAERFIAQNDLDGDGKLDRLEWGRTWGFLTTDADMDGRIGMEELIRRIAGYGRHRKIRLMPPLGEGDAVLPPLLNPTTDSKPDAAKSKTEGGWPNDTDAEREPSDDKAPRRDTRFVVSRSRRPGNLPSWFATRDGDGDGQLSMAEYAPKPTAATLAEFARYDRDGDGVITPGEYLRAVKSSGKKEER